MPELCVFFRACLGWFSGLPSLCGCVESRLDRRGCSVTLNIPVKPIIRLNVLLETPSPPDLNQDGESGFHLRNELPHLVAQLVTVSLQICVYG